MALSTVVSTEYIPAARVKQLIDTNAKFKAAHDILSRHLPDGYKTVVMNHVTGIRVISEERLVKTLEYVGHALSMSLCPTRKWRLASGTLWCWLRSLGIGRAHWSSLNTLMTVLRLPTLEDRIMECGELHLLPSLTASVVNPVTGGSGPLLYHAVLHSALHGSLPAIARATQQAGLFSAPDFGWLWGTVRSKAYQLFQTHQVVLTAEQLLHPTPVGFKIVPYPPLECYSLARVPGLSSLGSAEQSTPKNQPAHSVPTGSVATNKPAATNSNILASKPAPNNPANNLWAQLALARMVFHDPNWFATCCRTVLDYASTMQHLRIITLPQYLGANFSSRATVLWLFRHNPVCRC